MTCPFPHCPLPEDHDGPHGAISADVGITAAAADRDQTARRAIIRGSQEVSALSGQARVALTDARKALKYLEDIVPPEGQRTAFAKDALRQRRNAVADAELTLTGLLKIMEIIEKEIDQ